MPLSGEEGGEMNCDRLLQLDQRAVVAQWDCAYTLYPATWLSDAQQVW